MRERNDLLNGQQPHKYYGEYVIALSSFDQQYYLDRIVTNLELHYENNKYLYYDPAYSLDFHRYSSGENEITNCSFQSILKEDHIEDSNYCTKLYKQYLSWAKDRLWLQAAANGRLRKY